MSNIKNPDIAEPAGDSSEHRVARLLESPLLARVVPHLPAEALHQLIQHRGLDACGALVTSATSAQLTALLDLDLWRPAQSGGDERFDVERFGEWIEALVDAGDDVASDTVARLDRSVVVAGLSRYVRVFDPGIFEPTAQSDDEPADRHEAMREGDGRSGKPLRADGLECEMGGYIVRARRPDAWDAVVSLLAALAAGHPGDFQALMQGCRRLSNSDPEVDGLHDLLLAPEQHLHDVAIAREHRRSQRGYATAADARAFLQMAREPNDRRSGMSGASTSHPVVRAYFRDADANTSDDGPVRSAYRRLRWSIERRHGDQREGEAPEAPDALLEVLVEAGMMPARPRGLLAAPNGPDAIGLTSLRRLMAYVRDADGSAYLSRTRELAFLANVLLAGCSVQSRAFTPGEASDAAAAISNLGLEYWPDRWHDVTTRGTAPPESFLVEHDLVAAFEVGWSVLYRDVSVCAAEQLIATLDALPVASDEMRAQLAALRRTLVQHRGAGTPWRARGAVEVLAELDTSACISVVGLLDECPVIPAALTAILERRTTPVSPVAFEFISTATQVGHARAFMRSLTDVLSR